MRWWILAALAMACGGAGGNGDDDDSAGSGLVADKAARYADCTARWYSTFSSGVFSVQRYDEFGWLISIDDDWSSTQFDYERVGNRVVAATETWTDLQEYDPYYYYYGSTPPDACHDGIIVERRTKITYNDLQHETERTVTRTDDCGDSDTETYSYDLDYDGDVLSERSGDGPYGWERQVFDDCENPERYETDEYTDRWDHEYADKDACILDRSTSIDNDVVLRHDDEGRLAAYVSDGEVLFTIEYDCD